MNPQEYDSFESLPMYLDYRAQKYVTKEVAVTSDSLSSPHLIAPFPQVELGEFMSEFIDYHHPL